MKHDDKTFKHGKSVIQVWSDDKGVTAVHAEHDSKSQSAYLSNGDVPAFALAVLKAAGYGGDGGFVLVNSINTAVVCLENHVEKRLAEVAARNKRRDELANEFAPRDPSIKPNWYANVSEGLRAAIDRIIELERAAS